MSFMSGRLIMFVNRRVTVAVWGMRIGEGESARCRWLARVARDAARMGRRDMPPVRSEATHRLLYDVPFSHVHAATDECANVDVAVWKDK